MALVSAFAKQAQMSSNARCADDIQTVPGAATKTLSDIITGNLLIL